MASLEIIALNPAVPQLRAPQAGDTYNAPRPLLINTTVDDGVNQLQVNGSAKVTGSLSATGSAAIGTTATSGVSRLVLNGTTANGPELTFVTPDNLFVVGFSTSGTQRVYVRDGGSVERLVVTGTGVAVTGVLTSTGTISPQQATTAAAPAYVKGAMYFDTTLNKLRIGGATAWETVSSA